MAAALGLNEPLQGACYGFGVRSRVPMHYTRAGDGVPLTVVERDWAPPRALGSPILVWEPPAFPFAARLYRLGDDFSLDVDKVGWFVVESSPSRIVVPPSNDVLRREERLWGLPVLISFLRRGDLPIHAAAVEIDGSAVIVAGPSRAGKTTIAMACAAAGWRVLSEDLTCVRLGQPTLVLPGPAMLRPRPDVAVALPVNRADVLRRDAERWHLRPRTTGPDDGKPVELAAIVLLRPGHEFNREGVNPVEAHRALWNVTFALPTDDDRRRRFAALGELAAATRIVTLTHRRAIGDLGGIVAELRALVR